MSLSAAIASHDELTVTTIPGLLGLGMATILHATVHSPVQPAVSIVVPALLLCAALQILAGLGEWRRGHTPLAVTFTSLGLFTCSQLPQLTSQSGADSQAAFSSVSLLLFWGAFALLIAISADKSGRAFRVALGAVSVTLFAKAILLACSWSAAWPLALAAATVAALACGAAVYDTLASNARG